MPAAGYPLAVAPLAALLLIAYAVRPRAGTVAPLRLAAVRAALITGGFAVLIVESLGAFGLLNPLAFAVAWLAFLAGAGLLTARRRRRDGPQGLGHQGLRHQGLGGAIRGLPGMARQLWRGARPAERLLAGTVGGFVLIEFVIALLAEPNNFDSQTYHLPKVEHWAAQGDLTFWPTAIHRQVTIPPGAEYLLLHLRLLTSGDSLHNLVQWAAGVGCLLVATRIAAQFGGGRRAQLLTAFLVATTPMVALQATSTQTDLVVAAWAGCVATLALDGLTRRTDLGSVLALGAATRLTAITKTNGLLGAGPMLLLWGVAQLRLALTGPSSHQVGTALGTAATRVGGFARVGGLARTVGAGVAVLVVAAVFTGPFLVRVAAEFGHPLGPPRLRESIPMQRHDPGSVLINGLRIGHTALDTPFGVVRDATASTIDGLAGLLGVDPQDRATTFGQTTWPVRSWYPDEDRVAFPLAGTLVLVGGVLALVRPRRLAPEHATALRGYAFAVGAAVLLHTTMIKWQPWGNRLLLYALVLAAPLAGLWLDALFRRHANRTDPAEQTEPAEPAEQTEQTEQTDPAEQTEPTEPAPSDGSKGRRSVAVLAAVTVLAGSALAGVLAISYGFPRRLVGAGSVLTTSDWETRFLRRPQWADEFRWAADAVRAADARRIGLVQQNDNWEYPWWLLLGDTSEGDTGEGGGREIVALQSVLPDRPPADPASVDAIVCTGTRAACTRLVPPGWRVEFRGYVGYALPPN